MMRERTPFPRSLIEKLPKLKHLFTNGISVTGTPSFGYPAAEHAWALILALAKRVTVEDAAIRAGEFGTGVSLGLRGKTLGIIGLGKLGGQVADVGKAFGMNVTGWNTNLTEERCAEAGVAYAAKEAFYANADFISIHVHLGTRNKGLVGAAEIAMMKPTSYLINTARGPTIDEATLIAALRGGVFAGAGLDVFEVEPLQAGNPLLGMGNVVLTPHQGHVTAENYANFFEAAVANVRSWLDGTVINELP